MTKPKEIAKQPTPPKGNLWFIFGGPLLGIGNSLFVQKHGNDVPDAIIYGIYAVALLFLLIGVFRLEKFREAGGRIKDQLRIHRVSAALVCLVFLIALYSTASTLIKHHRGEQTSTAARSPPPPAAQPQKVIQTPSVATKIKDKKHSYRAKAAPNTTAPVVAVIPPANAPPITEGQTAPSPIVVTGGVKQGGDGLSSVSLLHWHISSRALQQLPTECVWWKPQHKHLRSSPNSP
jgi:hypothetical protein